MGVVQAGQHGPTRCVQHVLPGPWRQGVGNLVDRSAHPQVDGRALQRHRALNQHGAQSLSDMSCSTAALSAPSGDAGGAAGAITGGSAAPAPESGVCGETAYLAATCAIDTSITSPPPRPSDSPTARAASSPLSGSAIASPRNTGPSPTSPPATAASSPNAGRSGCPR